VVRWFADRRSVLVPFPYAYLEASWLVLAEKQGRLRASETASVFLGGRRLRAREAKPLSKLAASAAMKTRVRDRYPKGEDASSRLRALAHRARPRAKHAGTPVIRST